MSGARVGEVRKHPFKPFVVAVLTGDVPDWQWRVIYPDSGSVVIPNRVVDQWPFLGAVPGTPADASTGAADDRELADAVMYQWLRDGADVFSKVDVLCHARAQVYGLIPLDREDEDL